jgi:hypothetical protein
VKKFNRLVCSVLLFCETKIHFQLNRLFLISETSLEWKGLAKTHQLELRPGQKSLAFWIVEFPQPGFLLRKKIG